MGHTVRFDLSSSTNFLAASATLARPKSTSVMLRNMTSTNVPPPGGGAIGVVGELGLDVGDELRHRLLRGRQLGLDVAPGARSSPGCPVPPCRCRRPRWSSPTSRSRRSRPPGSSSWPTPTTACSPCTRPCGRPPCRSGSGARSILISSPDAALIASSWLVLESPMAAFPTTSALWSSGLADGPSPSSLICWAVPMALAFSNLTIMSNHAWASATSNPRPSGVNSSLPFWRSQVPNRPV